MNRGGAHFTKRTTAIAFALAGSLLGPAGDVKAADASVCQNVQMVKNLRAYTSRCFGAPAAVPKQLTRKEIKRLTMTAKSAEDHLRIARYYEAEAARLDGQAKGYEEAAAGYRQSPSPKNLVSPTSASRYDYLAQGFRKEAKLDRALAATQEQLAKNAIANPEPKATATY